LETVHGTIERLDPDDAAVRASLRSGALAPSAEDVLLSVVTDAGERIVVYAGRRSYLEQQGVRFRERDRIVVRGVRAETSGVGEVLIAKEIETAAGVTLVLFDDEGNPRWKVRAGSDGH
jgi:hypothetical protein